MNENENLQPVEKLTPFTKMVMSIGTLPSSFYASMSYYESMVWLYEYLKNEVIPTVNNNAEAVEELQEKYLEFSSGITEEVTDFKEYINGKVDELETYMNDYFTNLDVQEEINNKLDAMVEDGTLTTLIGNYIQPLIDAQNDNIEEFEEGVNTSINLMNSKINSVTNSNPIPVSSTSAMTDTTKIYVLTTDGYWYYYNGTNWVQGGLYQSSGIDENDPIITELKYRDDARFNGLLKDGNINMFKGSSSNAIINAGTGIYYSDQETNLQASETYIPVEIGKTYKVTSLSGGPLFNIYYYDANKTFIEAEYQNSGLQNIPVTFTNTNYGFIRLGSWKEGNSPIIFETKLLLQEIVPFIPLVNQTKGHITSFNTINIDTVNKKLITGPTTYINVGNNLQYKIENKEYTITDIITNGGWCYYHPDTDTIDMTPSDDAVFIGGIWLNGSKIDLFMNTESTLLVNGVPYKVDSEYANNKVLCLGDSMTAGTGTTTIYYDYLKSLLGKITPYSYGVGGSSITPKQGDFPSWDTAQSFLERYNNMRNDGDVIIVFGGVNDWVTGRNLGNINSTDTYTFYGAMKSLCSGLITKYPNKQIVFFTSPQNDYVNRPASIPSDSEYYGNTDGYNRQGLKLQDYTKAMVEVCNIYGIPCERLDTKCWYGLSGILSDGTISEDELHPNATGHKIIARNMASFIKANR